MLYSTNSTLYGNSAWYYDYGNGTILYFNGSYPMNFDCNATTDADPDIAGPGVIISFIVTAWITVLVASVPAFYQLSDWLCQIKAKFQQQPSVIITPKNSTPTPLLKETADNLLGSLCDLQIITGIAIVVAGLTQFPDISFYHENLAISYWWSTLNSFWAARIEYTEADFDDISRRVTMRRIGILISVILGLVFQCLITVREERDWDFLGHGACYLLHDNTSSWPWVVGTALYAVSLVFIIVPTTRVWMSGYSIRLDRGQAALLEWQQKSIAILRSEFHHPASGQHKSPLRGVYRKTICVLVLVASTLSVVTYWLLGQSVAIWSYGDGFGPLFIVAYICFLSWDTFDIIDLKVANKALIIGSETSWGFGQVLPMVLMAAIGYAAVDAIPQEKKGVVNVPIPLQAQAQKNP